MAEYPAKHEHQHTQGPYDAVPLPLDAQCIRLFTFDRSEEGAITGSLEVHRFDKDRGDGGSGPSFPWTALSYTWQSMEMDPDRNRVHEIAVNGRPFQIHENLWRALHCLIDKRQEIPTGVESQAIDFDKGSRRSQLSSRDLSFQRALQSLDYFWIDAICINQGNALEKNRQVAIMGEIFSRATTVIAWLTPDPRMPVTNVKILEQQLLCRSEDEPSVWDNLAECRCGKADCSDTNPQCSQEAVFSNPYWSRLWVVQEVSLAYAIVFLYEGAWITENWITAMSQDRHHCKRLVPRYIHENAMARDADPWSGYAHSHLLSLIEKYRNRLCSDNRDRVFGLLSLLPDTCPVRPDYSKSAIELVLDVLGAEATFLLMTDDQSSDRFYRYRSICSSAMISLDDKLKNIAINHLLQALGMGTDDLIANGIQHFFKHARAALRRAILDQGKDLKQSIETDPESARTVLQAQFHPNIPPRTPEQVMRWLLDTPLGNKELDRLFPMRRDLGRSYTGPFQDFECLCASASYSISEITRVLEGETTRPPIDGS